MPAKNAKKIINLITKEVYPNISEAAKSIGFKPTTLNAQLTGQNKNNTKMAYYAG